MTKDKDFKELVHARAAETGEKYTEARERLISEGPDQDRQPRIVGLENRYTVSADVAGHGPLSPDEVARYLFRRSASWGGGSNVYLANGARLYMPEPGVVEYATPECSSAREALCHVRAGESLLLDLARSTEARLAEAGTKAIFEVAADRSSAGGSHESYGAPRSFPADWIHELLVPFLVTRQVFTGSGGMVPTPEGTKFVLSPRAHLVSTGGDPGRLVNADAHPHADPERFRRIHIDVGDANRSDAARLLKIATTRLVLRVTEEAPDALSDRLTLEAPMTALRDVSLDPGLTKTVQLRSGRSLTALDVQTLVLRAVRRHLSKAPASNEERNAIDQWQSVIDELRSGPSALGSVEWLARMRRFESVDPDTTELHAADRTLDRIGANDGAFAAQRVCSDEEVEAAKRAAPTRTRAFTRARFIEACRRGGRNYTVDWTHLKLNDEANRTVIVRDPFRTDDARVQKFLEYVSAEPPEPSS